MLLEDVQSFSHESEELLATPVNLGFGRGAHVQRRLSQARRAFSTRNVDFGCAAQLDRTAAPAAGDLVLARVVSIGHHTKLESPEGRRQQMYPGDEIVVAYGNRYAPDQFEAKVPVDQQECDLVAGGGIAADMLAKNARTRNPTRIQPLGLLADWKGEVLNLRSFTPRIEDFVGGTGNCKVIVVVGTSMNAGKTTTAAQLIHGLSRAGLKVGAAKVTGTGSGGDMWAMIDAGARLALDFTDAGHATTAGVAVPQLVRDSLRLIRTVSKGHDVAIVEVADGLFQEETAGLLQQAEFVDAIDHVVLAAGDAMGAAYGHGWLVRHGLPISLIAGCVSSSPLGTRETEAATGLKVATLRELADAELAPSFCFADQPVSAAA
ncbi:DUF1611 domain-containing protein [Parerythrobacter aestuarii]|uniref:DUF1611 domain-containing protein n=1 Tax=Parerythrobacter aestuarii TaxID=3020909 RepID=UPI0024DEBCF3|nr:DUF1611 domain-containing protein [Parerythrobacter aestuarii]